MNIYIEAKNYYEELVGNLNGEWIEVEELENMTLEELITEDDYSTEYLYSVYTGALFKAIIDDLKLLVYAEEIEEEFDIGIASNPMMINEAILRYMIEVYGNYIYKDFKF